MTTEDQIRIRALAARAGAAGEAARKILARADGHWGGDVASAISDAAEGALGASAARLAEMVLAAAPAPATPTKTPAEERAEWVASLGFAVPSPDALWAVHRDEAHAIATGVAPAEARRRSLIGICEAVRQLAATAEYDAPRRIPGGMVVRVEGVSETGSTQSAAAPRWVPASAADMRGETDSRPINTPAGEEAAAAARAKVLADWAAALDVCRPVRDAARAAAAAAQAAAPRLTRAQRRAAKE
jgi:hypothetical protein